MAHVPERKTEAFTVVTDDLIASMISGAAQRLVVVAPAVSSGVAAAICERWRVLSPGAVTVVLDSDPEVYRLGYGHVNALKALRAVASEVGATIGCQPGLRIGVVIADNQTLIYAPTPTLVEAGQNTYGAANAIFLQRSPASVEADLGLGDSRPHQVGRAPLSGEQIERVEKDLQANPPQKFDLARKVRVFNSFIEFVELEVLGTEVSRRTVKIPSHLLAVADPKTREQLHATFRLVAPKDELSGATIDRDRKLLARRFLHVIPRYGTVVLRREKEKFQQGVQALEAAVKQFADDVRARIQQAIHNSREELVKSLMPALKDRPPADWGPFQWCLTGRGHDSVLS